MASIATVGDYVYFAAEDVSGFPVIFRSNVFGSFSYAYNPGAGTVANLMVAGDDLVVFYGNFGSGVQVVSHVISTGVNTNRSPSGLTTKVVNAFFAVSETEWFVSVNTDQDLHHTTDGGSNWSVVNSALTVDPTAMIKTTNGLFLAGNTGAAEKLLLSSNGGVGFSDIAGSMNTVADVADLKGKY